ncbi:hypothetical protein MC885_016896 [Smutsia gigantea]|nr:hypothetical protein MC885_016896 [Smutsia gigantea]
MEAQGLPAPCPPLRGSAFWLKESLGGGGAEGSAAKQGDGRDSSLAENRDWRQETVTLDLKR